MKTHRILIATPVAVLAIPTVVAANVFLKQRTDAFETTDQKKPAGDRMGRGRMYSGNEEPGFIARPDQDAACIIDHREKTSVEMPAGGHKARL